MARKQNRGGGRERKRKPSGTPGSGSGVGRKEEVRGSGVYPESLGSAPPDAAIRTPAEWGQAERGPEGYEDSGRSELSYTTEEAEEYQRAVRERRSGKDRRSGSMPETERPQE